jgi:hypothetical protein
VSKRNAGSQPSSDFDFSLDPDLDMKVPRRATEPEKNDALSLTAKVLSTGAEHMTTMVMPSPKSGAVDRVRGRTCMISDSTWSAVQRKAQEEGRTAKYYLLRGLQMQGFPVSDDDLEDRRGQFLKDASDARKAK